jgi:hypothetical protein
MKEISGKTAKKLVMNKKKLIKFLSFQFCSHFHWKIIGRKVGGLGYENSLMVTKISQKTTHQNFFPQNSHPSDTKVKLV